MNFLQQTEVRVDLALPVNKLTKADIILIISVILLSVSSIFILLFIDYGEASGFEIKVDGKLHSTYNFSDLKDGEIIEIKTSYGYNKFLYENKSIKCIDSSCKDKIEIKPGAVSKPNQVLVCLPNRLTVNIIGKSQIDAVSY